jgi:UDP-N-acetylglucosamine transferase subunit ALG13
MRSRTLLAASGGGHLKQLTQLAERLPWASGDRVWCTVDTPQSQSLLDGEEVVFVESADPRDGRAALANARKIRAVIRSSDFTHAVSTGASLAVSALPQARRAGASCHYVESAARVVGPSLSGRLLAPFRHVHRYTQYQCWAQRGWAYAGSVFDAFEPGPERSDARPDRVVVALGTQGDFGFRSLVERLVDILPPTADVLWQTGATDVSDLDIDARPHIPAAEFEHALGEADVVVAHAGVGSALSALETGRHPVLVPRRSARGEHVDDHQEQVARELAGRNLASAVEVDDLDMDLLSAAATRSVAAARSLPGLRLDA